MSPRLLACTKCRAALPPTLYNAGEMRTCPSCRARLQLEVFPASLHPPEPGAASQPVLVDGEASCFYHPAKRAVAPCESCGRFLCALCDVEMLGQHLCPGCIATGKKRGRLPRLEDKRTLYDNMALALAVYPMILVGFTVLTAPLALYVAIRYWNRPSSIVPRSKWRAVLAIILSGLQLAFWALALGILLTKAKSH